MHSKTQIKLIFIIYLNFIPSFGKNIRKTLYKVFSLQYSNAVFHTFSVYVNSFVAKKNFHTIALENSFLLIFLLLFYIFFVEFIGKRYLALPKEEKKDIKS